MKKHLQRLIFIITTLGLSSVSFASGFLNEDAANPSLHRVSEAFLSHDFKTMVIEIKNALSTQPDDPLVKECAFKFLQKAYEIKGQEGLPADWHLPNEITKMQISVRTSQKDIPEYYLRIYGGVTVTGVIKQLRVTHYPDQVVIDKIANIGEFNESNDPISKKPSYGYIGKKSHEPISPGLYLLHLELANGKTTEGWFLLDEDANATSTPIVASPTRDEVFQTGTPTFHWTDFQSPQYKPYEIRTLWMGVSLNEAPNYSWSPIWALSKESPTLEKLKIGSSNTGAGVSRLENGRYAVVMSYHEHKRFGDVFIGRDCATSRTFLIHQ